MIRAFVLAFAVLVAAVVSTPAAIEYRLDPPVTHVAPAALCTLSVVVDAPGDSLGCVECHVTWDASLVTLVSGAEGTLFKNSGIQRAFFNHAIAPDTFSVEGCLLGYLTFTPTPGEVARFIFRGDTPGMCPVRITRFNLWDRERDLFVPVFDPYAYIIIGNPTGVRPPAADGLSLSAYPNPFGPSTAIELRAPAGARVRVDVYTVSGERVRRLFDGVMEAETIQLEWDARDVRGTDLPEGVYFVTASSGGSRTTHKVILIK